MRVLLTSVKIYFQLNSVRQMDFVLQVVAYASLDNLHYSAALFGTREYLHLGALSIIKKSAFSTRCFK